jgi:hypothetical protein
VLRVAGSRHYEVAHRVPPVQWCWRLSWDAYCHRVGRNITPCGLVLRPPLLARTMRSSVGPQGGPQS